MASTIELGLMSAYQQFLDSVPNAHVTQNLRWPKVKARNGWKSLHLITPSSSFVAVSSASQIEAVALMLFIKDARSGRNFCYLPRGPVTANSPTDHSPAIREIFEKAYEAAKRLKASTLLIDPKWENTAENQELLQALCHAFPGGNIVSAPTAVRGQPPLNMVLDLSAFTSYEDWLAALSKKHRYSIRRAQADGAQGRISRDRSLVETLYELITVVAQRKQITHRPKQYFYDLFDAFEGAFFTVGSIANQITSLSLNIPTGNTVYNLYAGNEISDLKGQTSTLLNAAIVEEAFNRNLRFVDFGGVFAPDKSDKLYVYKRHFMPKDQDVTEYVGEVQYHLDS